MADQQVQGSDSESVEFDYGGCLLTDRGDVGQINALVGGESTYYGKPGIIEAIWLIEGTTPWPGPPFPRPVYRVRWRPLAVGCPGCGGAVKDAKDGPYRACVDCGRITDSDPGYS